MSTFTTNRVRFLAVLVAAAAALLIAIPALFAAITSFGGTMVIGVDLVAGATNAGYDLDFQTDVPDVNAQHLTVVFPDGYVITTATVQDLGSSTGSITIAGGNNISVAVTVLGQEVRLDLGSGQDLAGDRIQFRIVTGVKNPEVSGTTNEFTIKIGTTLGQAEVDTLATAGTVTITAGALVSANVAPDSLVAGAAGDVNVAFTTGNPIPADGKIKITFPSGFDVQSVGTTVAAQTAITGTLVVAKSGQVLFQFATLSVRPHTSLAHGQLCENMHLTPPKIACPTHIEPFGPCASQPRCHLFSSLKKSRACRSAFSSRVISGS